jgi:tetratricopeptide (TPR) repeat protein
MSDLDAALAGRPGLIEALALRGIAWSAMREYNKALDDLDRAIAQKETVESFFARAKAHEALNNPAKAADDFRRATQLAPASVFEALAQAESKRKIRELSKKVPCGSAGSSPAPACEARSRHAAAVPAPPNVHQCLGVVSGPHSRIRPESAPSMDALALDFQVLRRGLAAIGYFVVLDRLAFVERRQTGLLDGRNMHEHVLAARRGLDESITLGRVEPLHCTFGHSRRLRRKSRK